MFDRSSGILMPISSLPSKYGIGTFGKEAYNFIDFLHSCGQKYWQLLPMGPVSYGDSPYSPFSVYGGNPYYIDLEILINDGILSYEDCDVLKSDDEFVDYEKQFNYRYEILYKAFKNSKDKYNNEINEFIINNKWVLDYSLFMALKYKYNQQTWYNWDDEIKNREEDAINTAKQNLNKEVDFWSFLQYMFYEQYFKLKEYANNNGIIIIGDIPIYAAEDSADVWANSNVFMMDEEKNPVFIAGVPPDDFSHKGQLWGNPVYNWGYLKDTSYEWWINRIKWSFKLYDVVRIDHFRGFDEFWAVPYGSENAINGKWMKAYGRELFEFTKQKLGNLNIIAEDLGIITDSVIKLKDDLNFSGMKVLQFAFDGNPNNPYLPINYEENSVAYTGTHDNDTLLGWYSKLDLSVRTYVLNSLNIKDKIEKLDKCEIINDMIQIMLQSKASLVIIPLQDYMCSDSATRINIPSTLGGNWIWRLNKQMLTKELSNKIRAMTEDR